MSKKASKRARRRQLEQQSGKRRRVARHLSRPADPPPALPRPQVKEPFYLWQLGLHKQCFDDYSVMRELPAVIYRQ